MRQPGGGVCGSPRRARPLPRPASPRRDQRRRGQTARVAGAPHLAVRHRKEPARNRRRPRQNGRGEQKSRQSQTVRRPLSGRVAGALRRDVSAPHRDRAAGEDRPHRRRFEQHQSRLGPQKRLRRDRDQERRHHLLQRVRPFRLREQRGRLQGDRAAAGQTVRR
ncbi:hypothetical protein SDC9_148353 [bioreactor metagenome]|uniref:Uncharacterized protein n=1 Tax=bioreactor metagenome TaxID=1076179 RepID=A0A645EIJ6_9ZZZZ